MFQQQAIEAVVTLVCAGLIFNRYIEFFKMQPLPSADDPQKCMQYGNIGTPTESALAGPDGVLRQPESDEEAIKLMLGTYQRWETEQEQARIIRKFFLGTLFGIFAVELYLLQTQGFSIFHALMAFIAILYFLVQLQTTSPLFQSNSGPEFQSNSVPQCPSKAYSEENIAEMIPKAKANKKIRRKISFNLHPDRNPACVKEANQKFTFFQSLLDSKK